MAGGRRAGSLLEGTGEPFDGRLQTGEIQRVENRPKPLGVYFEQADRRGRNSRIKQRNLARSKSSERTVLRSACLVGDEVGKEQQRVQSLAECGYVLGFQRRKIRGNTDVEKGDHHPLPKFLRSKPG